MTADIVFDFLLQTNKTSIRSTSLTDLLVSAEETVLVAATMFPTVAT